jgi:gamma-glutamyltranspeptidase/glutathione hydrolase
MSSTRLMAEGHTHMISAGHPIAAQAGLEILESGGNAIDAGVAAAMVLGVVQSDLVNFAGVAPIMVREPINGKVTTISGLGRWPRKADIDLLIKEHEGHVPEGILRMIVPGAPDAFITALEQFGTMSFKEVSRGAVQAAEGGFIMHKLMAETIRDNEENYRRWPPTKEIYLPNGQVPNVGDLFIQSNLAQTFKYMADAESKASGNRINQLQAARKAFYEGDIASAIAKYNAEHGGWITMADLREFRVSIESPLTVSRQGTTLFTCGAWCQGISLAQIWSFLSHLSLKELGHNSAEYIHILTEVIKLVFADRELYVGDPDFINVPVEKLLSSDYANNRLDLIKNNHVLKGINLWDGKTEIFDKEFISQDTSYVCVVDSDGMVASITPSDGSANSPAIPNWGITPSSRGSQSWAVPDHPSCVAPWKRPRLTPNPAIALLSDGSVMPFGSPGADVQCQAMLQVLLNITEFNLSPQAAVEAPRFATYNSPDSFEPHTALPDILKLEHSIENNIRENLEAKGHNVEVWPNQIWKAGAVCTIISNKDKHILRGGADPRRPCLALGR